MFTKLYTYLLYTRGFGQKAWLRSWGIFEHRFTGKTENEPKEKQENIITQDY